LVTKLSTQILRKLILKQTIKETNWKVIPKEKTKSIIKSLEVGKHNKNNTFFGIFWKMEIFLNLQMDSHLFLSKPQNPVNFVCKRRTKISISKMFQNLQANWIMLNI